MKQISNTLLKVLGSRKRMQNINKTVKQLEVLKVFSFSDKIPVFSKAIEPCLLSWILHYLITYLSKKSVHISQFYVNHVSYLNVLLGSDQEPLVLELRTSPFKLCGTLIWTQPPLLPRFSDSCLKLSTYFHLTLGMVSIRSCKHMLSCLYLMLNAKGRVRKAVDSHCFLSPVEAVLKIFRIAKWGIEFHNLGGLLGKYQAGVFQF